MNNKRKIIIENRNTDQLLNIIGDNKNEKNEEENLSVSIDNLRHLL